MNIQQLEYIIAVDKYRHFAKAADASFVTQPTLSMMIQKLEEELGTKIFDRSKMPVQPTHIGTLIIDQARVIMGKVKQIKEIIEEEKGCISGLFRLGIIPTIAPYLLPSFMQVHSESKLDLELNIEEVTTGQIIKRLVDGTLDAAILATPLKDERLKEIPVYYEKFIAYVSPHEKELYAKPQVEETDMTFNNLWLLEDVHCFRSQILRLCNLRKNKTGHTVYSYEAGSINTLINIVDNNYGMTVIPEMAVPTLSEKQQKNLRSFKGIEPVREVSLVTKKDYMRERFIKLLAGEIKEAVPQSLLDKSLKRNVVDL
jgi:LysR family hydrogen peroxide-inducible transcriptional activator